jgi:hypothetical protein
MQDNLAQYYILFAAVFGAAEGIYWSSIHIHTAETMGGTKMASYMTWFFVVTAGSRIIFPITLGAIIRVSFATATAVAVAMGVALVLCTLILREDKEWLDRKMSMRRFFKTLHERNLSSAAWLNFVIQFISNLFWSTMICLTILTVFGFGDNLELGLLTSVFAACSIATITLYRLTRNPRVKLLFLLIAATLPVISAVGLFFGVTPATIIIIQIGITVFGCIPRMELSQLHMNIMKKLDLAHLSAESLVFNEWAFNISRFICFGIMAFLYSTVGVAGFVALVFVLAFAILPATFLLRVWHKRFDKIDK